MVCNLNERVVLIILNLAQLVLCKTDTVWVQKHVLFTLVNK